MHRLLVKLTVEVHGIWLMPSAVTLPGQQSKEMAKQEEITRKTLLYKKVLTIEFVLHNIMIIDSHT